MESTYYNGPLTICSGNQYRIRLEEKLRHLLGEKIIVGPMDASIRKCEKKGLINPDTAKTLLEISEFCDRSYTFPESESPSEAVIKGWSDVIDDL